MLAATEHRWDDAEKQFRIVLSQDANSASAWSNLGNVHLSKGKPQEAYRDFSEAIRLAPTVIPQSTVAHALQQILLRATE